MTAAGEPCSTGSRKWHSTGHLLPDKWDDHLAPVSAIDMDGSNLYG